MRLKKILSLLLAMTMLLSCVSIPAMAEGLSFDDLQDLIDSGEGNIVLENSIFGVATEEGLRDAIEQAQDGDVIELSGDIELTEMIAVYDEPAITIKGHGYSISPADPDADYNSAIYFDNVASCTIEDVVFDGWASDHVIRIQTVEDANIDAVTIKNSNQVSGLALISSTDSNTEITNSTFVDNTCLKVIDINSWGDDSTAIAKVSGNTFENNTTTSTGVIYYAVGGGFELSDNTFAENTVNANDGHGSVVYFSEGANSSVIGNTFKNNVVTASGARAGGALVLEAGTTVEENAFIDNEATSTSYAAQVLYKADEGSAAIDLSKNYWGEEAPGADDYVTVKGAPITLNSYYESFEDGTFDDLIELTAYVAEVNGVGYESLAAALNAAKKGDTINLKAGEHELVNNSFSEGIYWLPENLTIIGEDGAVVTNGPAISAKSITIDNVDFINPVNVSYTSGLVFHLSGDSVIKNSKIDGYWGGSYYSTANGNLLIEKCDVYGDVYGLHIAEGNAVVKVVDSKISGWNTYGSEISATFDNCEFAGNGSYAFLGFYNDVIIENCSFTPDMVIASQTGKEIDITLNKCTVTDGTSIVDLIDADSITTSNITVDGVSLNSPTPEETPVAEVNGVGYETFEEALAAAQAGDTVTILANELTFAENAASIVIDKAITIKGQGKENTELNFNSATSAFVIKSSNVTFKDMTIVQGTKDNSFHISVDKGAWNAPKVKYSDILISNIDFIGSDYALCLIGENVVVDSCTFTDQDSHNIIVYSLKGNSAITNNVFNASKGNNKSAILYEGGADNATDLSGFIGGGNLTISGNEAYNKGVFFQFTNWKLVKDMNVAITDNYVYAFTNKAIAIYDMDGKLKAAGDEFASFKVNDNAFVNVPADRPIVKEYTGTVEVDASENYLDSAEPDYAALLVGDKVVVENYYAEYSFENGEVVLENLIKIETPVAKIGDKYYTSFESAVADIKQDGSVTTIELLTDIETSKSIEFKYGTGDVIFTADHPVTVKQTSLATDWAMVDAKKTKFVIDENVTFEIYDNASGMYLYYGPSIEIKGSVIGGQNWGTLYLYNGDHKVTETGKIGVGRIQTAHNTLEVKGEIDTNYLLVEGATFVADGANVDAGVIYDNNNGGQRWGASKFVIKNGSEVSANKLTLSYADSELTIDTTSSITATQIVGSGKIVIDASAFNGEDVVLINADLSDFTGAVEVINNSDAEYKIENGLTLTEKAPELPKATVTEVENEDLAFALNFKADEVTEKQLAYYGDWYADFVLTVNKDVIFNANGGANGYLSGQYDAWRENWVNVPFEDVTVTADTPLKIMEYASSLMGEGGLKLTYNDVYSFVKDFNCGVFFESAFLAANPDLEVTLELRMYNPNNESESYAIGETYKFDAKDFIKLSGSGTGEDPFLIKNINDLILFRDSVNSGDTTYNAEGVYVALDADIDMAGVDWGVNIGDDCAYTFDGIFDGKNHTISNLTSIETAQKSDGYVCTGLFGAIYGSAQIKNLTIENATINTGDFTGNSVGVVAGFAYSVTGSIENVNVIGNINIDAPKAYAVGTIIGYAYYGNPTIKDCSVKANAGSYIKASSEVAGIVGYGGYTDVINSSVKNISIEGAGLAGGVAGLMLAEGSVQGATVENVTVTANKDVWKNSAAIAVGTIAGDGVVVSDVTSSNVNVTKIVGSAYAEQPSAEVPAVQAKIGDKYYTTLTAAIAAAEAGETVTLLSDIDLSETVTVAKGKDIILDLAGYTITGTDNNTSGNFYLINVNKGALTVNDNVGGGKITLAATNERNWNSSSVVIANNQGALTVNGGAIEHLGGTSMAYGIDNLTNGNIGTATTTIKGGSVDSTYFAVRQFANSETTMNTVEITGGDIGYVWMQSPNDKVNTVTTTISGGMVDGLCVSGKNANYTLSALASSLGESKVYGTMPTGKVLAEVDGNYTLEEEKEEVELFDFYTTTVTLANSLAINFYVERDYIESEGCYAVVEHDLADGTTKSVEIPYTEWGTNTNGYYSITYSGLVAVQMADEIRVAIYNSDGVQISEEKVDGIRAYAIRGFNKFTDTTLLTALADMLNYGAAAQIMFNYNVDDLATSGAEDFIAQYASQEITVENIQEKGENYLKTTLSLENNILLTGYFRMNDITGKSATIEYVDIYNRTHSTTVTSDKFVKNTETIYGICVDDLAIADAGCAITITVYNQDGTVYGSLVDSMNSYLYRIMQEDDRDIYKMVAKFTSSAAKTLN